MKNLLKNTVLWTALVFISYSHIAQATLIGNDNVDRNKLDTAISISFIDTDAVFLNSGAIDEWSIFGKKSGDIYLQVFRDQGSNNYELIGQNFFSVLGTGIETFNVGVTEQIIVTTGDIMGWSFTNPATIPHTDGGNSVRWTGSNVITTSVGGVTNFSGSGSRTYSINANLNTTPVPEPTSLALLGLGLAGFSFTRKKKKA